MEQLVVDPENEIIEKMTLQEHISRLDPEIQNIFYNAYGETLESFPKELLKSEQMMERFFEILNMMDNAEQQKLILMRLGFVSGEPMLLQEVAEKLGITRERVRQIENKFMRRFHRPKRLTKPIRDFYI